MPVEFWFMAKSAHNDVLDAGLLVIKNNANLMTLCRSEPTTRIEAVATLALADTPMSSSSFWIRDGGKSGRTMQVAARSTVTVDVAGIGTHVALVDSTRLLAVTRVATVAVAVGDIVDFPAWEVEISDPV